MSPPLKPKPKPQPKPKTSPAGVPTSALRLCLLRSPALIGADGSARPLNANDAALLALLAVDGPTSRERAIAMLWPDEADPARARNALRQRLFRLRRSAGCELIQPDELLALAAGVVDDLHGLQDSLAADPAGAAAGDLLGSLSFPALIDFSQWLDAAREQWRNQRRDVLAQMASQLEAQDHVARALVYAERLAREEPLAEHAQRRVMRLHYRRGDRAAALAVYAGLCEQLQQQLGESPATETRALAQQVQAIAAQPVALSNALPTALPIAKAPVGWQLLRPPRLVGRARECQQIEQAMAQGSTVFIVGEPGIGKSRLLATMAPPGAVSLAARPGDAPLPWALLARLLRALELTGRSSAGPSHRTPLPAWARAELARLLPELGAAAPHRLDPTRLAHAAELALQHAEPSALLIDDLQFADEASLAMLPSLAASTPAGRPCLLALRSHEPPASVSKWIDALDPSRLAYVALEPLGEAAVAELLQSLALPGLDAAAWAPRVHQHSGGNPLFVLETLRALLESGGGATSAWPLLDKLHRLIDQRLAQLSAPALKLARVAALAGPDFCVELAATLLAVHPMDLHEPWRELEAAQVMQGTTFAHDVVFECTRDSVPLALRRWLHARTAEWLHAQGGTALRCALHWRDAQEPARAAQAFADAAEQARAAGRLAEQARWLEAAIESFALAGQPDESFEAMVRLASAAREALPPDAAMHIAQRLLAAAANERQRGIAQLQVASCCMNAAQFDIALVAFEAAITAAAAAGDVDTAQHARYLQAMATVQLQGAPQALARMEALAPWAEAQRDESLRHSFVADLAILCEQADQRQRARPLFERALAYFDRAHEGGNAAPTRMMFARCLTLLGDSHHARTLLEQAVRDREELSEGGGGQGIEALNLGRVYTELGRYGEALALLQPWHQRLSTPGNEVVRNAIALVLARVYVHLGQSARALALLNDVPAQAPFHQQAGLLWTRALLAHERPAERAQLLKQALAHFTRTDMPYLRLPMLFDHLACAPSQAALQGLRAGVAECEQRELMAPQMLGRMRVLQTLTALGKGRAALAVARSLVDDLPHCQPVATYLPELYAAGCAAGLAAHDSGFAQHCQAAAVQWIAAAAQAHVPADFRDSFAHRNPVNRAVLTGTLGPR